MSSSGSRRLVLGHDDRELRAHEVAQAETVERADDLDPQVTRKAQPFAAVPGPVHHDAAWVVRALRIADSSDRVTARTYSRCGFVRRAGHAVSVQHEDRSVGAGDARRGGADLWFLGLSGGWAEGPLPGGVAHLLGKRLAHDRDAGHEQDDELHCSDGARDEGRGAPGANEIDGCGLLHGADDFFARRPHYPPAVFVTFEGIDGSGKSTQAELLAKWLQEQGRTVVATREPGGTPLGERVRELLLDGDAMSPWSEAALFVAARSELVERVIAPALDAGAEVVSDRYLDSSLAYQGVARGLGVDEVLALNIDAIRGLLPDVTFLLLVDVEAARSRSAAARDRIEREGDAFLRTVDAGYRDLAERFPERIVVIDGDRHVKDIAEEVREHVRERAGTG